MSDDAGALEITYSAILLLEDVKVVERNPFSLGQASQYPLFTREVIKMMHDLIPAERHDALALSVIVTANNP